MSESVDSLPFDGGEYCGNLEDGLPHGFGKLVRNEGLLIFKTWKNNSSQIILGLLLG